ncbi:uncharacterized protein LOC421415 [Gallus gallus]|uniref:uncharacterized protein LOC421415 n=1 Tax=Gallus gallus TaxID=9031 RepID=UPI001AE81716|nr:uncharacterized protein LOC421415 [Gallus gallus]
MRMNIVQQATYSYSSILHSIPALSSGSGTAKLGKPRGAGTSCREVQGGSTEVHPPSAFILLPELAAVILVANLPVQLYILQPENIFFSLSRTPPEGHAELMPQAGVQLKAHRALQRSDNTAAGGRTPPLVFVPFSGGRRLQRGVCSLQRP